MKKLALKHIRHSNHGMLIKDSQEKIIGMNDFLKNKPFTIEKYHPYSKLIHSQLQKIHSWTGKRKVFNNHFFDVSIHRIFFNHTFIDIELLHIHDSWAKKIIQYIQTDPLTELYQAEYFLKLVKLQLQKKTLKALIMFDLDYFKEINDLYGHQFGNKILIAIGKKIKKYINSDGFCSRFGGDEFCILIKNTIHQDLETVCKQLLEILSSPLKVENKTVQISASIGMAIFPNHGSTPMELIDHADIAMYESKISNRNNYHIYHEDFKKRIKQRLELYHQLNHAIKNNQLELFFQPILNLTTKEMEYAEIFIRWNHPTFGLIQPFQFIKQIDNHQILMELDSWVFNNFIKLIKNLNCKKKINFFINISSAEFLYHQKNLKQWINILNKNNVAMEKIILEIKEDSLISNLKKHHEQFTLLKKYNLSVSIEHLPNIISNLHMLKTIPTKYLKINRQFIQNIKEKENQIFLKSILEIAKTLHFKVIAEGIENDEELKILKKLKCNYGQGYLLQKPLDFNTFKNRYL